jgi:hypothetical protein
MAFWVYPAGKPKLNTNFSTINTTDTWNTDSYYHGLQASVKKTIHSELHIQSSYAYAKSIDTASSTGSTAAGSGYSGARAVPTPLLPGLNRGLSDFDLRHSYSFSLVWELPIAKTSSGLEGALVKGWQVGSIVRAQSGLPFLCCSQQRPRRQSDRHDRSLPSARTQSDRRTRLRFSNQSGDPNHYIKTECFSFPAKGTLGNVGRNTLTAPGNCDARHVAVQEFQKLGNREHAVPHGSLSTPTNHTNFAVPNSVVFDSAGNSSLGCRKITSTSTDSRRIQFGLKISF